jgi:hypothetical protein
MRNFVLDIIVIELCSVGVSPLKRQVNIALNNQSAPSGVILVSFLYYCGVVLVILCSSAISSYLFLFCILFYIWNITQVNIGVVS